MTINGGDCVTFSVSGVPVAKGRPRLSTRGGFARAYTPAKTRNYEDAIRIEAAAAMDGRQPVEEPCSVSVIAFVPMPQSMSQKKREQAISGDLRPVTRPDLDNYAKAALDACNGILYRDDSLVTDLRVMKRYAAFPRLVITMEWGVI